MPSAYHVHPEFGYFCLAPYRRRELRVAIVSILFGAIIGGSIATLRAGHDRNPGGASTAVHVDVPNSERVLAAAAEATPAATNDTKAEAKESIKPFPMRRVRVRPAVQNPPIPATDATAPTPAGVIASASPLAELPESAQGSGPPADSSHAAKSAAAQRTSTAVKKRQRIAQVQSRRRTDARADDSWHDNRWNYWTDRTYVDAYYLRAR
jgi:hypothetical protein